MGAELQPIDDPPLALTPRPRLANVVAPRPQTWKGVINPLGNIEPQWVGQHFFDAQNKVFYQALGPTAFDWRFVPPRDFPGSMVQSFVDFHAPANNTMSKKELLAATKLDQPPEDRPDHILDARTVAERGLRVYDQRCWKAGGVRIAMCRIRLELPPPVALFVGFASEPVHPTQPIFVAASDEIRVYDKAAIGVAFDDHAGDQLFGIWNGAAETMRGRRVHEEHITVRVEIGNGRFAVVVDDEPLISNECVPGLGADALGPRAAFFRYGRPA